MSNQPFLPFALPEIGEEEIQEVVNCLRSGWLTTGPKTRQFETDFEAMLNA
ncbi:DegT/DnrJ/EryC1/StrS family aminotransferase, partial [uncultured Limnobacter sp.]|uniref:DegT/DnrJ/EryC1/StrS family aminotransferase n=1 Tax=uncultured Limnobacter sp. TaxID=199681 RepID=UPI0030F9DB1B